MTGLSGLLRCATALAALLSAACATSTTIETEPTPGTTGQGGGSSSSASSTSTGSGPCSSAAECADLSDACNVGTCINGSCEKTPANEAAACDDGKNCTT